MVSLIVIRYKQFELKKDARKRVEWLRSDVM